MHVRPPSPPQMMHMQLSRVVRCVPASGSMHQFRNQRLPRRAVPPPLFGRRANGDRSCVCANRAPSQRRHRRGLTVRLSRRAGLVRGGEYSSAQSHPDVISSRRGSRARITMQLARGTRRRSQSADRAGSGSVQDREQGLEHTVHLQIPWGPVSYWRTPLLRTPAL